MADVGRLTGGASVAIRADFPPAVAAGVVELAA